MLCYNIQMSIYSISIRVRGIWINMLYLQQNGFKGFKWHFYYIFRFCLYWFSFVYCFTRRHLGFPAMLKIWQVPACKMEPKRGIIFWRNFFPPAPAAAPTSPVVIILYFYMSDQTNAVIISIKTQNQTSFVNLKSDNLNLFVIFSLLQFQNISVLPNYNTRPTPQPIPPHPFPFPPRIKSVQSKTFTFHYSWQWYWSPEWV